MTTQFAAVTQVTGLPVRNFEKITLSPGLD